MATVNKKSFSYAKSGVTLLWLTLIAKFMAFGRELAIAAYFGSTRDTDSFFIAYGLIANILYGLTAAFAVAFLPLYVEEKERKGNNCAHSFAGQSILFFSVASIVFSVAVFSFAGILTKIISPTVSIAQAEQITFFIRILTTGLIFSLLNSFACSLLDAERVYGNTAVSGIIYSTVIIIAAILFSRIYGIITLVIAVCGANLLQFAFSGLRCRKFIIPALPQKNDRRLWNMLLISLPILLSNTTVEINQVLNRALAVNLGQGVVSAFSYASTLAVFVTSTFVYSLVTMFFTEFSKAACADNADEKISKLLRIALKLLVMVLVPVTVISFICAEDIVTIALKRGKFTIEDVHVTASGLRWLALGFLAIVVKALFTKCFIALKNTRTPMAVSICEVALNIILALLLYRKFRISGIAAASSIANICAAAFLLLLLWKKIRQQIIIYSFNYTVIITVSIAALVILLPVLQTYLADMIPWVRFPLMAAAGFICFAPMYLYFFKNYRKKHTLQGL